MPKTKLTRKRKENITGAHHPKYNKKSKQLRDFTREALNINVVKPSVYARKINPRERTVNTLEYSSFSTDTSRKKKEFIRRATFS